MLKEIFIIYIFLLCTLNAMSQNEYNSDLNSLKKTIAEAADTFRTMPENSEAWISVPEDNEHNKLYFIKFNWQILLIKMPRINIKDSLYAKELFEITDSLIKTNNYLNKILAHSIYHFMITFLSIIENEHKEQNENFENVTKLMQDIFYSDIKYCGRYSFLLFTGVEPQYFTPKVIEEMEKLMKHPLLTNEDADFIFKSKKPISFIDTTGYQNQLVRFQKRDSTVDEYFVRNTYNLLEDLKKKGSNLKKYNDSLQSNLDRRFIKDIINYPIKISAIYSAIGNARIKQLIPIMEKQYKDSLLPDYTSFTELIFARTQFKDYEERIVSKIKKQIKETLTMDAQTYIRIFNDLCYIHTQKSFAAMAPLLLRKERINAGVDGMYSVSIGIYNLLTLNKYIANLPWEYSIQGGNKQIYDFYFEKDPYPQKLLMKMYKWMIKNEGVYNLMDN